MALGNPFASGPSSLDWSCNVKKSYKVCCLPGDGIGPEIIAEIIQAGGLVERTRAKLAGKAE